MLPAFFIPLSMVTVYSQVKLYCQENGLPFPNRFDMDNIGRMISTHFRRFWGINQPAEIISQAGFVFSEEPGKPILVAAYPDCFSDEMLARIKLFYDTKEAENQKAVEKETVQPEKVTKSVTTRKRKRIPFKPTPVKKWSAKPEKPMPDK